VVSIRWGRELAEAYDRVAADDVAPAVLGPMVDLLAELADGGPVVEFGVGTGRVALPLAARGLAVQGIELSPEMADQLRVKPGADAVRVTVGDMTTTCVPGRRLATRAVHRGLHQPGRHVRAHAHDVN
jgi:SAM-dependent methyltransferase